MTSIYFLDVAEAKHAIQQGRLILTKFQYNGYQLELINKKAWNERRSRKKTNEIFNLGSISKIFNSVGYNGAYAAEIKERISTACKKHNTNPIQYLKYLIVPPILAKVFGWTCFQSYPLPQNTSASSDIDSKSEISTYPDLQTLARYQLQTMQPKEMDAHWKLNEFFSTIFVIHLPQATERLSQVTASLKEVGVEDFELFEAVDGRQAVEATLWKKMGRNWAKIDISTPAGQMAFDSQRKAETGCYLSHLGVVKLVNARYQQAIKDLATASNELTAQSALERLKKSNHVLILEDDNGFGIVGSDPHSATLVTCGQIFRKALQSLPKDWQLFYLMAWSKEPEEKISPHLVKLSRALCLNAYAIHSSFYGFLIRHLEKIYDPTVGYVEPIDNEIARLHKQYPSYAILPSIAYQRGGLSSITSKTSSRLRQKQPERKKP